MAEFMWRHHERVLLGVVVFAASWAGVNLVWGGNWPLRAIWLAAVVMGAIEGYRIVVGRREAGEGCGCGPDPDVIEAMVPEGAGPQYRAAIRELLPGIARLGGMYRVRAMGDYGRNTITIEVGDAVALAEAERIALEADREGG